MLATICVSFVGCVTNPRKILRRGLKQPLVLRLVTVQGVREPTTGNRLFLPKGGRICRHLYRLLSSIFYFVCEKYKSNSY